MEGIRRPLRIRAQGRTPGPPWGHASPIWALAALLAASSGLAQQPASPREPAPSAEPPAAQAPPADRDAGDDNELFDEPETAADAESPQAAPPPNPVPEGAAAAAPAPPPPSAGGQDADARTERPPPRRRRRLDDERVPDSKAPSDAPPEAGDGQRTGSLDEKPSPGGKKGPGGQAYWEDHQEMGKMIGYGSIGVCEAVSAPLGLIPTVGTALGIIFEIACLYPGALSVDYIALFHGDTDSALWQAATAVILAKIWRVGTRIAAIAAIAVAGAGTLAIGAALLGGVTAGAILGGADPLSAATPLVWAPTLVGTVVVLSGLTYIVMRKARKAGQSLIYDVVYVGLTEKFETKEAHVEAQSKAYVRPPLGWWERAWVLMAMADGSDPSFSWTHVVPVYGRIVKARDSAEALKGHMRKVGEDVVGETPEDYTAMDNTIDTLATFEGGLGALAESALIAGAILCSVGLGMSAAYFLLDTNLLIYGLATTGVGLAGLAAGGAGVLFLLLREVPRFIRPFAVPFAYGPVPYEWLDEDGEEADADTGLAQDQGAE